MRREVYSQLHKYIDDDTDQRVIMIEGARQVGKSFLVKDVLDSLAKPKLVFDLEKDKDGRRKIDKTETFSDFQTLMKDQYNIKKGSILFIDEAQESKKLSGFVKSFKEDWPEVKVILTGSSMNRFFKKDERIPVGRTRSLCVFGFSFSEFLKFIRGDELAEFVNSAPDTVEPSRHDLLLSLFDDYIYVGGYPESVKAFKAKDDYTAVIEEIINSLEEDFERKESANPELFRNALLATANFIGTPAKYTQLKTTVYKAKQIIESMKAWHIILEVTPQALNPLHSSFLPKRYLHDLGVINLLRAQPVPTMSILNTLAPDLRTPLGGLFENAALINMLHGQSAKKSIFTWKRDGKTNVEVDFIFDSKETKEKIPIECKAALSIKKKHFAGIRQYLKLSGQKKGIIISGAPLQKFEFKDGVRIINIPIYLASSSNIENYILSLS